MEEAIQEKLMSQKQLRVEYVGFEQVRVILVQRLKDKRIKNNKKRVYH